MQPENIILLDIRCIVPFPLVNLLVLSLLFALSSLKITNRFKTRKPFDSWAFLYQKCRGQHLLFLLYGPSFQTVPWVPDHPEN